MVKMKKVKKKIKRLIRNGGKRAKKLAKKGAKELRKATRQGVKLAKKAWRDPLTQEFVDGEKKLLKRAWKKVVKRMRKKSI